MLPKSNEQRKKKTICQISHQKKSESFDENFASHAFSTLVSPSGYALNLKPLIKVSKVS